MGHDKVLGISLQWNDYGQKRGHNIRVVMKVKRVLQTGLAFKQRRTWGKPDALTPSVSGPGMMNEK